MDKAMSKLSLAELEREVMQLRSENKRLTKTNETLLKSEKLFHALFDSNPIGVAIINHEGVVQHVNSAYCQMANVSPGNFIGINVFEYGTSEIVERTKKDFAELLEKGFIEGERQIIIGSKTRWIHYSNKLVEQACCTSNIIVTQIDITELKNTEEMLAESEEKFRMLVSTITDAIMVFDADTKRFIEVNKACEELYGYSKEEFLKLDIYGITAEPEITSISILKTIKKKEYKIPLRYHRKKNGVIFPVEISGSVLTLRDRKAICGVIRDITERKRAEEALEKSKKRFKDLADLLPLNVYESDLDGNLIYANQKYSLMFGLSVEDTGNKINIFNFIAPEDRERAETVFQRRIKARKPGKAEYTAQRKDGTRFPIIAYTDAIVDNNGNATGLRGIIIDITDQKKSEDELRNSREELRNLYSYFHAAIEEERTHLARGIHDELGQALTALKLDMSWLARRLPGDNKPLQAKTQAMSKLIDETIDILQKTVTELRPEILDDLGLLAAIDCHAKEFENRAGIKCKMSLEPCIGDIDRELATVIFRIFQETLANIIRHANATMVKVNLREKAGRLMMTVEDNGMGITERQISDPKSFGLIGMRERIFRWGGEFKISGTRNKGTTVILSIPLTRKGDVHDKDIHR